jgi:hypothetical protein
LDRSFPHGAARLKSNGRAGPSTDPKKAEKFTYFLHVTFDWGDICPDFAGLEKRSGLCQNGTEYRRSSSIPEG